MGVVNSAGLDLIKTYEGFRGSTYRCPAGVFTVGYGHTFAAGPPDPRRATRMTRAEAAVVLARDVASFADGVAQRVRVDLNDCQFSALVSFAYNVGLGAFASSSVLAAVNRGQFDIVPRRLALWVKAGGRVMPGLVKRRSAEAILFMKDPRGLALMSEQYPTLTEVEWHEVEDARGLIDMPTGKPLAQSSTVWASLTQVGATLGAVVTGLAETIRNTVWDVEGYATIIPPNLLPAVIIGAVSIACAGWIINERRKRAAEDDV